MKKLFTLLAIAFYLNGNAQTSYTLTIVPPDSSNHNYIYCSGTPYVFTGTVVPSGPILTFGWECTPTANVAFNPSPANTGTEAITFPSGGTYTLTFIAKTTYGIDSTNYTVNVIQTPTVTVTPANSFMCNSYTTGINIYASGVNTYTWTNAPANAPPTYLDVNGDSVNVDPSTLTPPQVFNYTVTGNAVNGCPPAQTVASVTVIPIPTPYFNAHPDTICAGGNTSLSVDSMPITTTYTWTAAATAGLGASSDSSVPATPIYFNHSNSSSDTTVFYQVQINLPTCPPYSSHTYSVHVLPIPHMQANDTVVNCHHSGDTLKGVTIPAANVGLSWVPKGSSTPLLGLSSNSNEVYVNPANSTLYYVTPVNQFGCWGNRDSVLVLIDTVSNCMGVGIVSYRTNNVIGIYPNPNNGNFVIESNNNEKQTIRLYDVTGKLVLSQTINGNAHIDAHNLAEGIYNISLIGNEGMVNRRVVIVR